MFMLIIFFDLMMLIFTQESVYTFITFPTKIYAKIVTRIGIFIINV